MYRQIGCYYVDIIYTQINICKCFISPSRVHKSHRSKMSLKYNNIFIYMYIYIDKDIDI